MERLKTKRYWPQPISPEPYFTPLKGSIGEELCGRNLQARFCEGALNNQERRLCEMSTRQKLVGFFCLIFFFLTIIVSAPAFAQPAAKPLGVEVIKIGGMGIMSGPFLICGRVIMQGAQLAIEEINAAGGILGSKLELKFMDDELKPAVGVKNTRYLVTDWGAHFIIGVDSSGVAMAIGEIMPELDRIYISTHASTHRLTEELVYEKGIKHIFRTTTPTYQEGILPAIIFSDRTKFPGLTRWAGINCDYEYGYVSWSLFQHTLKKLRPEVEFVASTYAPFWTMDFTPHISAVMAKKPDGIFTTPWAGEGVQLARQALIMGVFDDPTLKVYWHPTGVTTDFLEAVTTEVKADKFKGKLWISGRYVHNWLDIPENKSFVKRFVERWGLYPFHPGQGAYDAIYFIKAALEKTRSLETAKVIKALEGMEMMTPGGLKYIRPEDHQAVYTAPAGRPVIDPAYPIAVMGHFHVIPAKDYFRHPPFEPIKIIK